MTKTERDPLAQIRSQTAAVIPAYQDEKHIGDIARGKGFLYVASGPLVRSSYHAADFHPVVRR